MYFLNLNCQTEAKDYLIAELWERGSSGIVESDGPNGVSLVRAFFEDDASAVAIREEFGGETEAADHRDWTAVARERLQPMLVGSRFFLVPEWRDDATPEGRFRIAINAGLAFGTGAHETTRLCLELLEENVRPGITAVDVGAGSGILSEAAALLGASRVIACDSDESAVQVAARNFEKAGARIAAFVGSAGALRSECADIVVANITPEWIVALAPDWMRLLRDGGRAILSGFEATDLEEVTRALRQAGADIAETRAEAEWRAVIAYRRGTV